MLAGLRRRDVQIILIVAVLTAILIVYQVGPFIAYGVPAVTIHTVTQTKPVAKSATILGSFGEWTAFEYYRVTEAKWESLVAKRYVQVALNVKINVKVEVTDLMLSGFLTDYTPPPFLIEETETAIHYRNVTIKCYAYGFKVTLAWSGSAQVSTLKEEDVNAWLIPWTVPDIPEMIRRCVRDYLVPDFNSQCYVAADPILLSVDAPTLAMDQAYTLRPDYLGICGMWLADYQTIGYTTGTAAEALPASKGTAVKLYRDKALTSPCWSPNYTADMGKPLLTPDVAYWLDSFAASAAWWKISLVNLGSQLVFDESKPKPNYISWAWEKYGSNPPAVAQWFRVDLAFKVAKDWTVPRIPQYEMPREEKEKMRIIVEQKPENQGVPLNPPSEEAWTSRLNQLVPVLIVVFVGTAATIVVYYVAKSKWGVKK